LGKKAVFEITWNKPEQEWDGLEDWEVLAFKKHLLEKRGCE
jgi:hypothetical protein